MKSAILALLILLATHSVFAGEKLLCIDEKQWLSVTLSQEDFSNKVTADLVDNYLWGKAECSFAQGIGQCTGRWQWPHPVGERVQLRLLPTYGNGWVAELRRAKIYGGKVVQLLCKKRNQ